jgi:branched-chain amino acid transport system substrate-binding protein
MKKLKAALIATLALGAAMPALAQDGTLKIGALVTLSGAGASWGQGMLNGLKLAAEDYNNNGGIKVGDKTYRIEVIPYDDAYKANEAVTAANRLVHEDKVKFMIGPVGAAPALAIQPITEKASVIIMTLGFSSQILSADKPYSFRPNLTTAEISQPQVNWLAANRGVKTVGGLFPNDETGQQVAKDVRAAYEKAGAKLTAVEFFERDRVDFVPLLTRIIAQGVDAIELDGNAPATTGQIVQQARDLGFDGLLIRTGGPATQDIINVAGADAAEGMLVHSGFNPTIKTAGAYQARHEAQFGPMNGFSPFFYDGSRMLLAAIQAAGTIDDTNAVRKELEAIKDFDGVQGKLNWTGAATYGSNHQIDAPFFVAQIKNGKEVIVATCNLQSCK